MKVQEVFYNGSLSGNSTSVEIEYKGLNKPKKRAFYLDGTIYLCRNGSYSSYANNGRNAYFLADTVPQVIEEGFSLSVELRRLFEEQKEIRAKNKQENEAEKARLINLAVTTGFPVVIFANYFQTTASVGWHYTVALPNGQTENISSGCPTSSHSDRFHTSTKDAAILAAISEYHCK